MNTERTFAPGFRLSFSDVLVLIAGGLAFVWLTRLDGTLSMVVAFVLGHFFLFCNVIRMARTLELIWAGQFSVLSSSTLLLGAPTWPQTYFLSLAGTLVLIAVQVRKPSYHGVFWKTLNPGLRDWWQRNSENAG